MIWRFLPDFYDDTNTIMFDDVRRNFLLNPQNGLRIRPFRNGPTEGRNDCELQKLEQYLLLIKDLESFKDLNHNKWEKYVVKKMQKLMG